MRELEKVASQFGVSEPVFEGHLLEGEQHVDFRLKNKYWPDQTHLTDPIAKLIASRFDETFDKRTNKFVHSFNFESIYKTITVDIKKFYATHAPLKNPKQSRLYKWLDLHDNTRYSHPASEGFIALYRYIYGAPLKGDTGVRNVLAILELMKEKYEVEQEAD